MNQLRNWWARIGWKSVSHMYCRAKAFLFSILFGRVSLEEYEMFTLSFNFRYYQDLEAQRNRFRWVSRKQSDRWHQAHDAQVTKSQESKDLTFCTFPMIALFRGNCWHDIYPTWRTASGARKPQKKKFIENWKPFAFQGFEGFSDLRTSFLSRFTSGLVFSKVWMFWLIELHVCLLPSNHFLKTSISKQLFGLLCPLWRCGCVSMKWMSQSCHPQHQAVEHTRWPTPPYGVWQERKAR